METGTHVVNQDHADSYQRILDTRMDIDFANPALNLTIRPFQCTDNVGAIAGSSGYKCQSYVYLKDRSAK